MATGAEVIIRKDEVQGITYYRREGAKKLVIYAYFSLNGRRIRFSTKCTDKKQAALVAQEKYALAVEGKSVQFVPFKKVADEFLEDKKNRRTESTYKQYKVILGYVKQFLGDTDIRKINNYKVKELERWRRNYYKKNPDRIIQQYKRNGKVIKNGRKYSNEVSNRTINLTIGLTISVLNYAVTLGYTEQHLVPSNLDKFPEGKRDAWLEMNDFVKLYNYYKDSGNTFYACIVGFSYFTGIRVMSEVNRLKWRDVNFEKRTVLIRNRKHKNKIVNTLVPLFKESIVMLEEMKKMHHPVKADDFVFRNKNGKQVSSINKSFSTAIRKCNLDEKITPYALRHSFATFMVEETTVPMPMIAKIMGHADTQMLEKTYSHLRDTVAANTALSELEKVKKNGGMVSGIGEEVETRVDIPLADIYNMIGTLGIDYKIRESDRKKGKKEKKKK